MLFLLLPWQALLCIAVGLMGFVFIARYVKSRRQELEVHEAGSQPADCLSFAPLLFRDLKARFGLGPILVMCMVAVMGTAIMMTSYAHTVRQPKDITFYMRFFGEYWNKNTDNAKDSVPAWEVVLNPGGQCYSLTRIDVMKPPDEKWKEILVDVSCDYFCSYTMAPTIATELDRKNKKKDRGNSTISFDFDYVITDNVRIVFHGMESRPSSASEILQVWGIENDCVLDVSSHITSFTSKVDKYSTSIIGSALLVVVSISYGWMRYLFYHGEKAINKANHALTPTEVESLAQCIKGEARIIPGGSFCDDFTAWTRNNHELVSLLFPMRFSPTARHERLMVVIFQLGMTYLILAVLMRFGMVPPETGNYWEDNLRAWGYEFVFVSIPAMLIAPLLDKLVTYDLKQLYRAREEGVDVHSLPDVIAAKEKDARIKLKTNVSELYYLSKTTRQRRAETLQNVTLGTGVFLWTIGLIISATFEDEMGFIAPWLMGVVDAWLYWFIDNPLIFSLQRCRSKPLKAQQFQGEKCNDDDIVIADKKDPVFVPPLLNEQIANILEEWVSSKQFYSPSVLGRLVNIRCRGMPSYHYKFQSFGVTTRETEKRRPYRPGDETVGTCDDEEEGEVVDGRCKPDEEWTEHEKKMKVPQSANVQRCTHCKGTAKRCFYCNQSGQLLCYKEVSSFFGVPHLESVSAHTDLPDYLIKTALGIEVLHEESNRIPMSPVKFEQSRKIELDSAAFVEQHSKELVNDDRIDVLKQMHTVHMVPTWEIFFDYAEKRVRTGDSKAVLQLEEAETGGMKRTKSEDTADDDNENENKSAESQQNKFFIFGHGEDKHVFFPSYPQKCFRCNCMDGANCTAL